MMRIPLTQYGLPQVVVYPAILVAMMAVYATLITAWVLPRCDCAALALIVRWAPLTLLAAVLIWVLSFFRDPHRVISDDPSLLLSPADGTIAAIEKLDSCPGFEGKVLRIEIFLSIFNVHINRVPCAVQIGHITYKPGKFVDARRPDCSKVNEANEVEMFRLHEPKDRLLVRQISGAVARRIVCKADTGETFAAGGQFGMIKFGSCTELYVPMRDHLKPQAAVGDKVKAGLTILARYDNTASTQ